MMDVVKAPAVATAQGLRGSDLASSEIGLEHNVTATANQEPDEDLRWKAVREHIAKGDQAKAKAEQHYITAGQHLAALKAEHIGTWAEWEVLVKEKAGIGKSRASELMLIADGTKTVEQVQERAAKSMRQSRAHTSPQRCGENAGAAKKPAEPVADAALVEPKTLDIHPLQERARSLESENLALRSEVEELKSAPEGDLVDRAVALYGMMIEEQRKQFLDRVKELYPPRRGRPPKQPQVEVAP
jgi:hypothetical protein